MTFHANLRSGCSTVRLGPATRRPFLGVPPLLQLASEWAAKRGAETAPFVAKQRSRPAVPLVVRAGRVALG
jgi:hypothetical protein